MKKGIEFADETWNPAWGCLNECEYCYARPIAKRFEYRQSMKEDAFRSQMEMDCKNKTIYRDDDLPRKIKEFEPVFLHSQLNKKFKKSSTHIFVNSMSDIMWWEIEWFEIVLKRIAEYPEKTFIFFTKQGLIRTHFNNAKIIIPQNCIIVNTTTTETKLFRDKFYGGKPSYKNGICIEPMQERFSEKAVEYIENNYDWLIIGAETGNRKDKVRVKLEWIEPFYDLKMPVFMKESLRSIVPQEKFRQERI